MSTDNTQATPKADVGYILSKGTLSANCGAFKVYQYLVAGETSGKPFAGTSTTPWYAVIHGENVLISDQNIGGMISIANMCNQAFILGQANASAEMVASLTTLTEKILGMRKKGTKLEPAVNAIKKDEDVEALEKKHLGDHELKTGIYHPDNQPNTLNLHKDEAILAVQDPEAITIQLTHETGGWYFQWRPVMLDIVTCQEEWPGIIVDNVRMQLSTRELPNDTPWHFDSTNYHLVLFPHETQK